MCLLAGCGGRDVEKGPTATIITLLTTQKTEGSAGLGGMCVCWRKIKFTLMC